MSTARNKTAKLADDDMFEKSLSSKPFVFVVGEERREFHLHRELIGQLSPVLDALVNGRMREAQEGRVEWLDLDVDTFVRFAKFAYSGDYTAAEPELVVPEGGAPAAAAPAAAAVTSMPTPEAEQDSEVVDSTSGSSDDGSGSSSSSDDDDGSGSGSSLDDDDDGSGSSSSGSSSLSEDSRDASILDRLATLGAEFAARDGSLSSSSSSSSVSLPTFDEIDASSGRRRSIFIDVDHNGIMYSRSPLPYSIQDYMSEWDKCLAEDYHEPYAERNRKRRRLGDDHYKSPIEPARSKYTAMLRFRVGKESTVDHARARAVVNENPDESHEPVFLSHARLYVLADKYGVDKLRRAAVDRLRWALLNFVVHRERVPDLVALVHEIFDNTLEKDDARDLLVGYFACIVEDIRDVPEFAEALRRGGDFPLALVSEMAQRRM